MGSGTVGRRLLLFVIAAMLFPATAARAATATPTRTDDPSGAGSCPADCSLRQAISYVGSGGTVNLNGTTYTLSQGALNLSQSVTITGQGANATVIQQTQGTSAVIGASGGAGVTVNLNQLEVTGGHVSGIGGGIDSDAVMNLTGVRVTGNTATGYFVAGPGAQPGEAGGILNFSTMTIRSSSIDNNQALPGPASAGGGGIVNNGQMTIVNSTIANNQAGDNSHPSANATGGGMDTSGGGATLALYNVTLAGNTVIGNATNSDGGNFFQDSSSGATTTVTDSIFAQGTAPNGSDCAVNLTSVHPAPPQTVTYSLEDTAQCGFTQQNTNPLLGPLQNNGGATPTMALGSGSPAVAHGNPSGCPDPAGGTLTVDQRGVARPASSACDLGAYQFVAGGGGGGGGPGGGGGAGGGGGPPGSPTNTSAPSIAGTPNPDNALTCSTGAWTNNPTSYAYQWNRDGQALAGATGNRYTVQIADEAHTLTCTVTASNGAGAGRPATSAGVLVALPGTLKCPQPSGSVSGKSLGPLRLGMTRKGARGKLKLFGVTYNNFDNFCLYAGWGIRVGYPSQLLLRSEPRRMRQGLKDHIILALTANPFYALGRVHPGMTVAAAKPLLGLGKPFQIGANTWYITPGKAADGVLKVRHGVIQEVGLADRRLTGNRKAQSRLLGSFRKVA